MVGNHAFSHPSLVQLHLLGVVALHWAFWAGVVGLWVWVGAVGPGTHVEVLEEAGVWVVGGRGPRAIAAPMSAVVAAAPTVLGESYSLW